MHCTRSHHQQQQEQQQQQQQLGVRCFLPLEFRSYIANSLYAYSCSGTPILVSTQVTT
jgi:hypothetical protein